MVQTRSQTKKLQQIEEQRQIEQQQVVEGFGDAPVGGEILDKWSAEWIKFIKNNPDKDWNWSSISENQNITWKIIQDNPDCPWDWSRII